MIEVSEKNKMWILYEKQNTICKYVSTENPLIILNAT